MQRASLCRSSCSDCDMLTLAVAGSQVDRRKPAELAVSYSSYRSLA